MINTPIIPVNEKERIQALKEYNILDTINQEEFDRITQLASLICETPIALVSLIDEKRQWFKSKVGLEVPETPRDISFCQHAILNEEIFSVEDASLDSRFKDNPLVTGYPDIKFYAGYPLVNQDGFALGTLCVIDNEPRSLTEKQKSALKLLANEVLSQIVSRKKKLELEELEKLFDLSQDFICITDLSGILKRVNPIFINKLGYSKDFLLSIPFVDLIHEDDIEATNLEIEKLSKGLKTLDFVNRYRKKNGEYITLNWLATFDINTQEIYAIARDISDNVQILKDLEKSRFVAEKALKAKDEFLTNMSHEIRTPLNAIIGFNDLLIKSKLSQTQLKYVSIVNVASQNLMVIINDILDSGKLDSGHVKLEEKVIDLKEIAEQVIHLQSNAARKKGIKLMLSLDTDLPKYVIGDQTRLTQILINIISNAIKFTDEGEVLLRIMAKNTDNNTVNILFSVKDTGIGIDKKKLGAIFNRFVQAENSTTRIYGGTGLGLNIVKMLVELYNGKLEVFSKVNEGSEFVVEIDFPTSNGKEINNLNLEISNSILEHYKVLIVEDNEHNQFLASTYLEKKGAEVDIAENGVIAIEKIKSNNYDLILMDLQMPKLDGYKATMMIREDFKMEIPIIGCSAHSLVGEKEKCISIGMNGYISKPFTEKILIGTIVQNLNIENKKNQSDVIEKVESIDDDVKTILNEMENENGLEFVNKMIAIFQKRIPKDIVQLKHGLAVENLQILQSVSHLLAGSLSSMNFEKGSVLSKSVEQNIENNEIKLALENTNKLISYLDKTLISLN